MSTHSGRAGVPNVGTFIYSSCMNIRDGVHMLYLYIHTGRLAKPTKEIGEVLRRLSGLAFTMEYKYDGERAQVHLIEEPTRSGRF